MNLQIQEDVDFCCDCEDEVRIRTAQHITEEGQEIAICDTCIKDYEGMSESETEEYRIDLAKGREVFQKMARMRYLINENDKSLSDIRKEIKSLEEFKERMTNKI